MLSVYVPSLTYGHKLSVVTKEWGCRCKWWKISFWWKVLAGFSLRDSCFSSTLKGDTWWSGDLTRTPPMRVVLGRSYWGKAPGKTQDTGEIMSLSSPIWAGRSSWAFLCRLLPSQPETRSREAEDAWMDELMDWYLVHLWWSLGRQPHILMKLILVLCCYLRINICHALLQYCIYSWFMQTAITMAL